MSTGSQKIKCVVWDLDDTIWQGILLESSEEVRLKPGIQEIIKELDSRGILNSIASKNEYEDAMSVLKRFRLDHYFLYPEIHWNAKSLSLANIQKNLNIGMDAILFIDDQPFERDEVKNIHPEITCMDASEYRSLLSDPRLQPRFVTDDSKRRRLMYLEEIERQKVEQDFQGPSEDFLATLNLEFVISDAREEDLKRAEELTLRTNQLNATGHTYGYDELNRFRQSSDHRLLICELTDKYGSYGKVGLALIETGQNPWILKLLLMSCRVMSRGVGTVLLSYIMQLAKQECQRLQAFFRHTGQNRMMYITYRFAQFSEIDTDEDGLITLESDLSTIQGFPSYIRVRTPHS